MSYWPTSTCCRRPRWSGRAGALRAELATASDQPKAKDPKVGDKKAKPAKAPAKERTEPLNFRVTPDFRRAFKRSAAAPDCKKVELLERIFAEWRARNPA